MVSGQWGWYGGGGLHESRSFQQMPVHISADLEAMEEKGKGLGFCVPLCSIQF